MRRQCPPCVYGVGGDQLDIAVLADGPLLDIGEDRYTRLRRFNLIMGSVHLISGAVMLALSNDFLLPLPYEDA